MELSDKLEILADAAKYDASCASSGAPKRSSEGKAGIGATSGIGTCHSYTPDGRCVSLLKILLTNFCVYDNRRTSNVPRARFSVGPIPQSPVSVPLAPPPMLREHRLYQADFLLRSYAASKLLPAAGGNVALDIDPKEIAPFIVTADYSPARGAASSEVLRHSLAQTPQQMNLWSELKAA